jgi:putative phage-type endonuclease
MGDLMILEEDLAKMLENYELTIYKMLRDDDVSVHLLKNAMQEEALKHYDVEDATLGYLYQAKRNYVIRYVCETYRKMVERCKIRLHNKHNLLETMAKLQSMKLPEQRSKEWYEMRNNVLTASSLADALGKGHFNTREGLLIDKTTTIQKPFVMHEIMEWGVKYEPIATMFYEYLYNVKILEFGLVPHQTFPIFGASPDGICDIESPTEFVGRMLEIKCPPRRQFTADVPEHYWMQMQGQLETCDLEECDFLQVKLLEYPGHETETKDAYQADVLKENDIIQEGLTAQGLPKGLVLSFKTMNDDQPHYTYEYAPLRLSYDQLQTWKKNILDTKMPENGTIIESWYRIERYECTLVLRDRSWWLETMPKIIDFWEDVEKYRKEGNQSLLDKRDARKQKRKISLTKNKPPTKSATIIQINKEITEKVQQEYLLDTSDDE